MLRCWTFTPADVAFNTGRSPVRTGDVVTKAILCDAL